MLIVFKIVLATLLQFIQFFLCLSTYTKINYLKKIPVSDFYLFWFVVTNNINIYINKIKSYLIDNTYEQYQKKNFVYI